MANTVEDGSGGVAAESRRFSRGEMKMRSALLNLVVMNIGMEYGREVIIVMSPAVILTVQASCSKVR